MCLVMGPIAWLYPSLSPLSPTILAACEPRTGLDRGFSLVSFVIRDCRC